MIIKQISVASETVVYIDIAILCILGHRGI